MTIEREYFDGPIIFRCDGKRCNEYTETHCQGFMGAIAKAKSRGWKAYKFGEEWQHICPDCQ